MRPIDADELLNKLIPPLDCLSIYLVQKIVKCAPTIDAVEVVRCKDCEEYIPWLEGNYVCGLIGSYFGNTKPNDFCSRGVRKMDAEVE